jgi:hypothetical protein
MEAEMGGTWNTYEDTRTMYLQNVIAHDRSQSIWKENTEVDKNILLNRIEISEDGVQW